MFSRYFSRYYQDKHSEQVWAWTVNKFTKIWPCDLFFAPPDIQLSQKLTLSIALIIWSNPLFCGVRIFQNISTSVTLTYQQVWHYIIPIYFWASGGITTFFLLHLLSATLTQDIFVSILCTSPSKKSEHFYKCDLDLWHYSHRYCMQHA